MAKNKSDISLLNSIIIPVYNLEKSLRMYEECFESDLIVIYAT